MVSVKQYYIPDNMWAAISFDEQTKMLMWIQFLGDGTM